MKHPLTSIAATIVLLAALGLVGCSSPEKQAQKALEEKGYTASARDLVQAAAAGDIESLPHFVQAGLDIDATDANGNTALIKAATAGQRDTVERILGMGADPRHTNSVGRDALLSASSMGFDEVARMLISRGADATLKDTEGWTALSIAAYNGHAEMVSLLASQAPPESLDDALLVASFSGDSEVISKLLGYGANINARSPESKTPLMIASAGGKFDAVRVLLQNQANPYAEDGSGRTAANLAELGGHFEVKDLILAPDEWGSTPESLALMEEMNEAQQALISETTVEETLEETGVAEQAEAAPASDPAPETVAAAEPSTPNTVAEAAPNRGAGNVAQPNPETATKIRQQSKSKPIVALNGSTIHSRTPRKAPVQTMVLASFHEEPLPIEVSRVDGHRAEIRRLDQNQSDPIPVEAGSSIPGTPYEVEEVTRKFVSSKEGQGRMVDVSRVKVRNRESGSVHLLVQDVAGQSSDTYAILTSPDSQYRYAVKRGDVFRTSQPDTGVKDYQVLDIRAGGVVVKDLATEDVLTIARDGVIAP